MSIKEQNIIYKSQNLPNISIYALIYLTFSNLQCKILLRCRDTSVYVAYPNNFSIKFALLLQYQYN